jgi:hypothetical protein
MSDGSTSAVTVVWSASGGTISSAGLYTAGQTAGSFRVIASESGGTLADTSAVSVAAPPLPPPTSSEGCPTTGYLRLLDVSTSAQLTAAVNGALAGDQIRLAPGNYNYGSGGLKVTRSGTAANRIVLCGPRTAIVNAYVWVQASYWHVRGFRIRGDTPVGQVWGVYQNIGGNNIYENLEVDHQNQEGIVIHDGPSYNNEIKYNYIHDTGIARADRGECIYIGNGDDPTQVVDNTSIHHNRLVNCRSEGVEIKSGSAGNTIEFNTITNAGHGGVVGSDAPIQIRGNDNQVRDNIIDRSPRYGIELWVANAPNDGNNNVFHRNTISSPGNGKAFYFQSGHSGNVAYCDNVAVAPAVLGVSCTR